MEETVGSPCVPLCHGVLIQRPNPVFETRLFTGNYGAEKQKRGGGGWERVGGEQRREMEMGRKEGDAQTNASLGNRCNQLSQSAND